MALLHPRPAFQAPDGWLDEVLSVPRLTAWTAWVDGAPRIAHLPLCAWTDAQGVRRFESHCPAQDAFADAVKRGLPLLGLLMGPQAFISSSWCADRARAPTWNYIAVALQATATPQPEEEAVRNLARLSDRAEQGDAEPWSMAELGRDSLARRLSRIVCFSLDVTALEARFKLGQDEPADEVPRLAAALRSRGHADLAHWMDRALAARPAP
jgi:transcriptional regulator